MNILITGGAGFIGSNVAAFYAKDKKNKIFIIDNFSRSYLLNKPNIPCDQNWNYLKKNFKNISLKKIDLRNSNMLEKIFQNEHFDFILHAAGQTAVTSSIINPKEDFENNVLATFNLLESIRKYSDQSKLIYCSTNKVYGDNPNSIGMIEGKKSYNYKDHSFLGIKENFPIDITKHTPYGVSKLTGDLYTQEYSKIYDINAVIFRQSCIYGPNQISFEDQGWIAHIIKMALENKHINIYGDGKQVRDILYISDLINAYDLVFNQKDDSLKKEIFCIGGGKENSISILELIEILEKSLGYKLKIRFHPWRKADQKIFITDITKIKKILNWIPKISYRQGLLTLIEHHNSKE